MLKKTLMLLSMLALSVFIACNDISDPGSSDTNQQNSAALNDTETSESSDSANSSNEIQGVSYDDTYAAKLILQASAITVIGTGVTVDGTTATISAAGTYLVTGTLTDGQIVVDTDDAETVMIVLSDASISSNSYAPLYIENAQQAVILLDDETVNKVTDLDSATIVARIADETLNAALYSTSDLTITGDGELQVTGNYADGITSKDGLTIGGGTIQVNAVDDGIRGKDYLVVENGDITVYAAGDGLKSDGDDGFVTIEYGAVAVYADGDAIDAETDVLIVGGDIVLVSGGGSDSDVGDTSAKGIKSDANIIIDGGTVTIDSADDGINSKDNVTINGGSIDITSGDEGINTNNTLVINGGGIMVTAAGDGLKSENNEDTTQGSIAIAAGTIEVTAEGDAISASTSVSIIDGLFTLTSGGGSDKTISDDSSAKAIKGTFSVTIAGGTFVIDAADDAIHSNDTITIDDGVFTIATGDDGVHADSELEINGGSIDIVKSYEGLESVALTINDGVFHIISSDDGINGAGGVDQSGFGGWGGWVPQGNCNLAINGGYIVVSAIGDGLDINGSFTMTGGDVIVNGPTFFMDSAIDYDGSFSISGGTIIAVGSSGMAQTAGASSSQYAVLINFSTPQTAGTVFALVSDSDDIVVCMKPEKTYQSIAFSSPELVLHSTYRVYTGGSSSGTLTDSLYEGGTYTPGTEYTSFTINDIVTIVGGGWY